MVFFPLQLGLKSPSSVSLKSSQRITFVHAQYADPASLGFCMLFWAGKEAGE